MLLHSDEYKPEIIESEPQLELTQEQPSVEIYQPESSSSCISGFKDNSIRSELF